MTGPARNGRPSSRAGGGRPRRRRRRPGGRAALLALSVGMALVGAGASALLGSGPTALTPSARPPARTAIGTPAVPRAADGPSTGAAPAALPLRIRIPGIGVDSALTDLQVQPDGHLAAPKNPEQIGWWSDGPHPGDPGAAVIVGHLDSRTGPAAFYGLSSLHPGDTVSIERADRSQVGFTVQALRQYDKDAFPDSEVYATGGPPQLRLITCGGSYDREQHEYRDNLVVYATLTSTPNTPRP